MELEFLLLDQQVVQLANSGVRYIEFLSAGNIEGFLAEGGEQNEAYGTYRGLKELGDDSKQANDAYDFLKKTLDGQDILAQAGENHFKEAIKKWLLEGAIQSVDLPSTLRELKRLRNETPRITPRTPYSPDFEAVYTLAQEGALQSQTISG